MRRSFAETPLTDVAILRKNARRQVDDGAVTAGYAADGGTVFEPLNDSLATELVGVLRCWRHHFMACDIDSKRVVAEFPAHSNEEQGDADQIVERIVQLGGAPYFSPESLAGRIHAEYLAGSSRRSELLAVGTPPNGRDRT